MQTRPRCGTFPSSAVPQRRRPIIPILKKAEPKPDSASNLTQELVNARQAYDVRRESVLKRAIERQRAVEAQREELARESASLSSLQREAGHEVVKPGTIQSGTIAGGKVTPE